MQGMNNERRRPSRAEHAYIKLIRKGSQSSGLAFFLAFISAICAMISLILAAMILILQDEMYSNKEYRMTGLLIFLGSALLFGWITVLAWRAGKKLRGLKLARRYWIIEGYATEYHSSAVIYEPHPGIRFDGTWGKKVSNITDGFIKFESAQGGIVVDQWVHLKQLSAPITEEVERLPVLLVESADQYLAVPDWKKISREEQYSYIVPRYPQLIRSAGLLDER